MELREWLVSEMMAPTLTLSAFCDTEFGSVLQRQVRRLRIANFAFTITRTLTIQAPYQSALAASPIRAPLL
jgi:hypothetical protein